MKRIGFLSMSLLLFVMSHHVLGKPVRKTSLKKACQDAPFIVIAEIGKHQFESIDDGKTISVHMDSLWQEYKILKILRNKKMAKKIKKGETLRLTTKRNSSVVRLAKATREKEEIKVVHDRSKRYYQIYSLKKFRSYHGIKVILFLNLIKIKGKEKVAYSYFGWTGMTEWTKKMKKKVKKLIQSSKKKKIKKK